MSGEEIVARALSAVGKPTRYKLGAGGRKPQALHPAEVMFDRDGDTLSEFYGCDCSGFAAWCLGVPRWVKPSHPWHEKFGSEWVETTNIVRAALSGRVFVVVKDAQPGDLIVYGDSRGQQGHVGVVTPVGVCHCSVGNFKRSQDAIQDGPMEVFWHMRGAIYARLAA